jgi:hypothetical protein
MPFKKITADYSDNNTKAINTHCGQNAELLIFKSGDKYNYHQALKA